MAMGEHVPVKSTNIASVAYDADAELLEVKFTSGSVYQYAGVPAHLVDGMKAASSPGGYFGARIRSDYRATKIA